MKFIADFHIHSKYSRAVSKDMVLEEIDRWAANKGLLVMGTGDFTHPQWFREIQGKLEPSEPGLFKLKEEYKLPTIRGRKTETRFVLTTEISSIYSKRGRLRRIHNLVFAPDIETAGKINTYLSRVGNLSSDGRPILGLDSEELAKIIFNLNPEAMIVPSHIWTPWFSVFGSMSGFDSLEECFGKYTPQIFAIETGLSSDPAMNWRLSKLDNIAIISNSDAHSLQRIGREANVFEAELSYRGISEAIKNSNPHKSAFAPSVAEGPALNTVEGSNQRESAAGPCGSALVATIEFFPEEGKYHFDGHRLCRVCLSPEETKKYKNMCPECKKPLTVGVLNRVHQLADRPEDYKDPKRVPFESFIPLDEIAGEALDVGPAAKSVKNLYQELIKRFGDELVVLREADVKDLSVVNPVVAEGIKRVREGKLEIRPGYDGEYGTIKIFSDGERASFSQNQASLF